MQWTTGEVLVLADQQCVKCFGLGSSEGRGGKRKVCHCVYRAVFRGCLRKFRTCSMYAGYISRVQLTPVARSGNGGKTQRAAWAFRNEEFMADFVITARRALGPESLQYAVFRFHHLYAADWRLCLRRLAGLGHVTNRGEFYHEVYRVESKLGQALGSIEPHALYPTDQYFASRPGRPSADAVFEDDDGLEQPESCRPRASRFPLKVAAAGTTEL